MDMFLSATPIELGAKLLENQITKGVYVIDEPLTDGIQKKALFNAITTSKEDGWDQGYYIDFIYEGIPFDRDYDTIQEDFLNAPEVKTLFRTFYPLSDEVAPLDEENTKMKIVLEYFFDITQEEAQNSIEQLVEQFSTLDDAIKKL